MNTNTTSSAPQLLAWSKADRLEVLLTSVLINILSLALPLAMLQVYDRVIPNKSLGTITLLILGVGVAILLDAIMRFARAHLMAMIGARFEHKAGSAAIRHLLGCDLAAFEQEGSGVHIDRFNALNQLRDYYGGQAYVAIFDLPFILLFIAMVFYFGGELGIVLIALLVIYGLGVALFGNRLATAIERLQRADDSRFDYIISTLTGLPLLKAQAMEPIAERRYETFNLDSAVEGQRVNQRVGSLGDLSFLMSQLAIVVIVAYGAYLVINGHLSVGGLAACTLLAGRTMQPLNNIVGFWTRFQSVRSAEQRFKSLFAIPPGPHAPGGAKPADALSPTATTASLTLKNVAFRWPESDADLFSGIDISIAGGEFIAITGPNGEGKSVLMSLMRGFTKPVEGEVLIDDIPLSAKSAAEIEHLITYLPQKEALFNGTILQNITAFRDDLINQGLAAAELVELSGWVQNLPEGYQTKVGAGAGDPLPRGIAQRVALARALVNNSKILLFDDANSAVDQSGDIAVKKVLAKLKGHTTVVVVSHRPSILDIAHRIFHLSDGRLTEQSPPDKTPEIEGPAHA
tara:strand:- start:1414 stop:3132 length:1719 start_codon:yes stop_codon:yes gene_type:complete